MLFPAVTELLGHLAGLPAIDDALEALRQGSPAEKMAGLTSPAKALVTALAATELRRPALVLVEDERRAASLLEVLQFFYRTLNGNSAAPVLLLPALDTLPGVGAGPHPEILEVRASTLARFVSGQGSIVVAPIDATLLSFAAPQFYESLSLSLTRDAEISLQEVIAHLAKTGYMRTELVEMEGQFSVRGGILDVFPAEAARPARIELLGDMVESLREFDPDTQRSTGPVNRVILPPLTEFPLTASRRDDEDLDFPRFQAAIEETEAERAATLFDLREGTLLVLDEPEEIAQRAAKSRDRLLADSASLAGDAAVPFVLPEDQWKKALDRQQRFSLEELPLHRDGRDPRTLKVQPTARYHGQIQAFLGEIRGRLSAGDEVLIAAASSGELERLADLCREYDVPYRLGELEQSATGARLVEEVTSGSAPAAVLLRAPLPEGFVIPEAKLAFYGTGDLFETAPAHERPRQRPKTAGFFSDFSELKAGDHVVHVDHGIGQFEGLQTIESDGRRGEFMRLQYADDARLYVPLERMDLVQNYRSLEGTKPQLDRLGGTAWTARKTRVRKSLTDLADTLLELYAERKTATGYGFAPDAPWQHEFEDAFEFSETPDQATAIADIKRDMETPTPMDRLLCGDVGYGKTEVAMRAAFKAVANSKQVAVLAPTTVLVFQHYETFRRRMAAFPIRVEMLSRFRSPREQKEVLAALEAGKVDILIGTHRLLSRDVVFHDLGLLIVDEEQRFGVTHKERLKEMSRNVDVLTMTATPIPRTLNMSLVGLRDMSVIETPPKDRLAIQTVVAPFSESAIRRAIVEELDREGQVFFVHNRVESIYSMAALIQKLAPKARVVVGHGQMGERELEKVMLQFIRDEADVLVSTTIVENGLDIPLANTIIVNRADRFGLSELYQLRGRVGRSNQRAYAYLLVPPEASLTPVARRRLAALREFSELGAGFRIAALDLELRGAGNLLGREQHGHIAAIGFDLYTQMLERAVAAKKGEAEQPELRATLNLGMDIRIPPEYLPSESLRLRTYKRIAEIRNEDEREILRRELADRFGPPPPAINNLLDYAVLKSLCERLQISSVDRRANEAVIKFYPTTSVRPERLVRLVRKEKGTKLDPSGVLTITLERSNRSIAEAIGNVLLPLETGS
ncbi:MAG: transcription-repair coupling factor [Acidobacteria bacterium]|nr:MAG: transcription-repair coupling factor [Acidobacteriota bacterium]